MTANNIPPCPKCGVVPEWFMVERKTITTPCECMIKNCKNMHIISWDIYCDTTLGRALRDLGIETVAQVTELVGIACDACDERTVRATNRAENLVPLLRRRASEGEK